MSSNISNSFPSQTKLRVSVNSTTQDQNLCAYLQKDNNSKNTKIYLVIVLLEELKLNIKTRRLENCKCWIPALNQEAESVNIAATLISKSFEIQRKSNTKCAFREVFFEDADGKLWPLKHWRDKVEEMFGVNIKNVTNRLSQKVNQPEDFYRILDLMYISRRIAQFLVDLGLNDSNENDQNDIDIKIQNIVNTLVGVEKLKQVLKTWKDNDENASEAFWQNLLKENSFILSQIFSIPVVILSSQAYVGGKGINNTGGNILDFIVMNKLTKNVALIEIKTPATRILQSEYRNGVYNISSELAGAVSQLLSNRDSLVKNYDNLVNNSQEHFETFNPDCILILGNATKELLEKDQKSTFENHRFNSRNVNIITYDEMFEKIKILVNLLEGKD